MRDIKPTSKKSDKDSFYLDPFEGSLIDFLANTPAFKKQFAQLELGSDKAGSIDDHLLEYMDKSQKHESIDPTEDERGTQKPKKGITASAMKYVKGIWNGR